MKNVQRGVCEDGRAFEELGASLFTNCPVQYDSLLVLFLLIILINSRLRLRLRVSPRLLYLPLRLERYVLMHIC